MKYPTFLKVLSLAVLTQMTSIASEPLFPDLYTADPSAHVYDGRLYVYPSHDPDVLNEGDFFPMRDYHVFSTDDLETWVDHGVVFDIDDVPWSESSLWAPDVAEKDGKYYFYFPAKTDDDFQIGVAVGDRPEGPFIPNPEAIKGSYSIDPCVFKDDDGIYYMYFGGLGGDVIPDAPLIAKMDETMQEFGEAPKLVDILDQSGEKLKREDLDRYFFEGAWLHKYDGKYYLSYSTGSTHFIVYATSDSPYGPFTYQGKLLDPVSGWTTHHSIVEFKGKWYLFYHDSSRSGGETMQRCVKMTELFYTPDGEMYVKEADTSDMWDVKE